MKRGPQRNLDKKLSINNLLDTVRKGFRIPEPIKKSNSGRSGEMSLQDCLMSAFAMFSLKSPSLLSFDEESEDVIVKHNLETLYKIKQVPSDTYMRERLDLVDPKELRDVFLTLFEQIQRGKLLERYTFLNGYLLAMDGTQIFESNKISCSNCCKKEHRDGSCSYYHQILAGSIVNPNMKQVISLCPEPITKQDGTTKNDCESRAMRRFLDYVKSEHPKLHFTIVSDALSANAPTINLINKLGFDYIINVKPTANKSLFDWISGLTLREVKLEVGKNNYTFRSINGIPLNDTKDAPIVNFLECISEEMEGKKLIKKVFTWITSHKITDENVYDIMLGGRARWKIENETFNTLKNQGYQFEHNFGHGKKNLHTIFAMIMMLAFCVDQIQEAACGTFQLAMKKRRTRVSFWRRMQRIFYAFFIKNWEEFFNALAFGFKPCNVLVNTS